MGFLKLFFLFHLSQLSVYGNLESSFNIYDYLRTPPTGDPITPTRKSDPSRDFLICHDFQGGYKNDAKVYNNTNESLEFFIPTTYLKNNITEFVYFAHKFITIPPISWINLCHRFGIKCYGTIITEWEEGKKLCSGIFQNIDNCVDKLVEIQRHFNFDGWLLNIENPIGTTKSCGPNNTVDNLTLFLRALKEKSCAANANNPHTKIIWYDSVTISGNLNWQNKLCRNNKLFYDLTDGIFLNYWFSPAGLQESFKLSDPNFKKVYGPVDCYAPRSPENKANKWPLGGFDCRQVIDKIEEFGQGKFSWAIFAPGWLFHKHFDMNVNKNKKLKGLEELRVDSMKNRVWNSYLCNWKTGP